MTEGEKLQEAVILLRDLIAACTKGDSCPVCGEVYDEVFDNSVVFPKCELYTAELWLETYYPEPDQEENKENDE